MTCDRARHVYVLYTHSTHKLLFALSQSAIQRGSMALSKMVQKGVLLRGWVGCLSDPGDPPPLSSTLPVSPANTHPPTPKFAAVAPNNPIVGAPKPGPGAGGGGAPAAGSARRPGGPPGGGGGGAAPASASCMVRHSRRLEKTAGS
jgi:hypothetical protein